MGVMFTNLANELGHHLVAPINRYLKWPEVGESTGESSGGSCFYHDFFVTGLLMAHWHREKMRTVEICYPFGKRLHNYGKSPFLMGKLTINGHFQ